MLDTLYLLEAHNNISLFTSHDPSSYIKKDQYESLKTKFKIIRHQGILKKFKFHEMF